MELKAPGRTREQAGGQRRGEGLREAPLSRRSSGTGKPRPEKVEVEVVGSEAGLATLDPDAVAASRDMAVDVHNMLRMFFAQRSELTVRNYKVDLEHFTRWMIAKGQKIPFAKVAKRKVPLGEIEQMLVALFRLRDVKASTAVSEYMHDLGSGALGPKYSVQTSNHRLSVLKALAKLARGLGISAIDLSHVKCKKPKLSRKTEGCGEAGIDKLMACSRRRLSRAQDDRGKLLAARAVLIVVLLYEAGLRRFEPLSLRFPKDVDLEKGRLFFRRKKRDEPEWFDVGATVVESIRDYLRYRGTSPGLLFPGEDPKKPIDRSMVNRVIGELAREAGVTVTPHGLRHTAATTLLEETGGNVRAVAEFLGHSDLRTVQQYDDDRKKLAKQMGNLLGGRRKKA